MRIELQNIHKQYGRVKANDGISLRISPGQIHGILGENGAGKSTLVKILAGFTFKTGGAILIDGKPEVYRNPAAAANLGIGMLYQDPLDFPHLTALENFMLGQIDRVSMRKMAFRKNFAEVADPLGFRLHPDTPVKQMTVGERQQLEIIRLLALGVQALVLDEPTTGISSLQKGLLFKALKRLATQGKTIVLVSHKLEDMQALCDKVTVLRRGRVAGEMDRPLDTDCLTKMMFEKTLTGLTSPAKPLGEEILAMDGVSGAGERTGLKDCRVVIRRGEIVGLAGLEGSGQGVFLRIAAGLKRASGGSVRIRGREVTRKDYHHRKQMGVAFMPAARLEQGLIPGLSLAEHYTLLGKKKSFLLRRRQDRAAAVERIADFRIRGEPEAPVDSLSGGNQQRFLLSLLPDDPILLLLENPTRGLDMESMVWGWHHLQTGFREKTVVVFSSTELDELMMVADRVLVFFDGRISKDVYTADTKIDELGGAIAGRV